MNDPVDDSHRVEVKTISEPASTNKTKSPPQNIENSQIDKSGEMRQSLIDNFKKDINVTDIEYTSRNTGNMNFTLSQNGKKKKESKKNTKVFVGIATLVVVVTLAIVLPLVLKSDAERTFHPFNPVPPPPPSPLVPMYPFNPYYIQEDQNTTESLYGDQTFTIVRNTTYNKIKQGIAASEYNQFINSVTLSGKNLGSNTLRMQLQETPTQSTQHGQKVNAATSATSWKDNLVLSPDYLAQSTQGVRNSIPLKFYTTKYTGQDESSFYFSVFAPKLPNDTSAPVELLTTKGCNFAMMTQYLQQGFIVNATAVMGLGERNGAFNLSSGVYTLYPYFNGLSAPVDDGIGGGKETYGQHPFLMLQLTNGDYFGIFLYNTYAQSVNITRLSSTRLSLDFIAVGGSLDFFFFIGPTYIKVIQQFQQVIGKPTLLPYWAHGFHSKSEAYQSNKNIEDAIKGYQSLDIPVESYILPLSSLNKFENFNYTTVNIGTLQQDFPNVKTVQPFTSIINNVPALQKLTQVRQTVKVDSKDLIVHLTDNTQGLCMDVFNPLLASQFLNEYLSTQNIAKSGFWLSENTPSLSSYSASPDAVNPFANIPFVPGFVNKGDLNFFTLPMNAQHTVATSQQLYHYETHGLFGTQLAVQLLNSLNETPSTGEPAFIISDSTFSGAGKFGVGHIFAQNKGNWDDLLYTLTNLINFNMFGIPNVGPNLCETAAGSAVDPELCVRFFQLSIISPLAVFNDLSSDLNNHPYKLSGGYTKSIYVALAQRFQFITYMRTELYKISKNGGALIRPLAADFPGYGINLNTVTSVMYGQNIKADFSIKAGATTTEVFLPGSNWLDLNSMVIIHEANQTIQHVASLDKRVPMFQKSGSVIPIQSSFLHTIQKVEDNKNIPLILSILLDTSQIRQSHGYVLLEDGTEAEGLQEYYYINAMSNIISIKQMNNGTINSSLGIKQIGGIVVSNLEGPMNMACALMQDLRTVQQLYAESYNVNHTQGFIQANDPKDSADKSTIAIDNVAFIYFGFADSTWPVNACNTTLFSSKVRNIQQSDYTYEIQFTQNLDHMTQHTNAYDVYLNITLLSDNSIYFFYSMEQWIDYYDTPPYVLDRNFSSFAKSAKTIKLQDVITINNEPFWFEIHEPENPLNVYYSTKDQINVLGLDIMIMNAQYPQSDPNYFFGLGERKGQFFLQHNRKYALQSNGNNVPNSYQRDSRVVEYGKSGFFPIVFSKLKESQNLVTTLHFSPSGKEFLYSAEAVPRLSMLMSVDTLEYVVIFNLPPDESVQAVQNHIKIGSILDRGSIAVIKMPPTEWFFGLFHGMQEMEIGLGDMERVLDINNNVWPLEGFGFSKKALNNYQSLTFNEQLFPQQPTQNFIYGNQLKFVQLQMPTVSANYSDSTMSKNVFDAKCYITPAFPSELPTYGQNEQGTVVFIDFSSYPCGALALVQSQSDFALKYYYQNYILEFLENEVTNKYCDGDCFTDSLETITEQFLFNPGNDDMIKRQLSMTAQRALQADRSTRNLNGLMQSLAFQLTQQDRTQYRPTLTASTTIGSGTLGHAAHTIDYIDITSEDVALGVQSLQSMSVLGNSLIGFRPFYKNIPEGYTPPTGQSPTLAQIKLSIFSTFTYQYILDLTNPESLNIAAETALMVRWRYMLIKYSRTQVFKQLNHGNALVRPLFFDFGDDANVYDHVDTSYMYGPSILVSISMNANTSDDQVYIPKGHWCSLTVYSDQFVTYMYSVGEIISNPATFAWIKRGSIVPMQNPYGNSTMAPVRTTQDLWTIPVDLHVLVDLTTGDPQAQGELMVQALNGFSWEDLCYLKFILDNTTLTVTDQAIPLGGTGKCNSNQNMFGDLYLYGAGFLFFESAVVNSLPSVRLEYHSNFIALRGSSLNLQVSQIKTIVFSKQ